MAVSKKPVVKKAVAKKAVRKPVVKQTQPQLSLFSDTNLGGTRRRFAGPLGVRNLGLVGLDNSVESLQFSSNTTAATLVLFADRNYQGRFLRINATRTIEDLADENFENLASSFIMANFNISVTDIQNIQNTREAPANFGELLRIIRKGRQSRKGKK
ncbi:MAG: hypothetical protein K0R57_223 [Paenibacillaceae bacterium]|nr:hypothetical protein [Paenibacillaceae bacterium]